MKLGAGAALVAASAVFLALILTFARGVGTNYEEVVPYVLTPLDIRDGTPPTTGSAPRLVVSDYLPKLAFAPTTALQLPLLNQLYMSDHLSYGGVVLAALGMDRLWAARVWHALFGVIALWLLFDIAILLGLGTRGGLLTVAIAATSLHMATCYTPARFDESMPSFGAVSVLWAALHYGRARRQCWVWIGVVAAALAVSAKITALWPLFGLAVAGLMSGWRPPALRSLVLPVLATSPLFVPMVGFAIAGPSAAHEVGRRLAFFSDLLSGGILTGTAANLIGYLGSWGSIISQITRGAQARGPNLGGYALVCGTLLWLTARMLAPGPVPRRRRLESQMLAFLAVVFTMVTFFYREHRDYQFQLVIPLDALALAAFLGWCAERFLDRHLPRWASGVLVCALPLAVNLWDHRGVRADLSLARNAMVNLHVQRAAADWLVEQGAVRPLVVTFYEVGIYELLSDGAVRPVYGFPLFRQSNDRSYVPDPAAAWRALLGTDRSTTRYAVVPVGENAIEARHFDETAMRTALLEVATGERAAVFANAAGEPVLEIWRVTPRASSPPEELGGGYGRLGSIAQLVR